MPVCAVFSIQAACPRLGLKLTPPGAAQGLTSHLVLSLEGLSLRVPDPQHMMAEVGVPSCVL